MTTHRFTPKQTHHVDQAHASALQVAVVGLAILRSAERAASAEPLATWVIEELAQKHLEAMGSAPSPGRAQRGNDMPNSPDSKQGDGHDSEPGETLMGDADE